MGPIKKLGIVIGITCVVIGGCVYMLFNRHVNIVNKWVDECYRFAKNRHTVLMRDSKYHHSKPFERKEVLWTSIENEIDVILKKCPVPLRDVVKQHTRHNLIRIVSQPE